MSDLSARWSVFALFFFSNSPSIDGLYLPGLKWLLSIPGVQHQLALQHVTGVTRSMQTLAGRRGCVIAACKADTQKTKARAETAEWQRLLLTASARLLIDHVTNSASCVFALSFLAFFSFKSQSWFWTGVKKKKSIEIKEIRRRILQQTSNCTNSCANLSLCRWVCICACVCLSLCVLVREIVCSSPYLCVWVNKTSLLVHYAGAWRVEITRLKTISV